ncbi:hypothetical protein U0070_009678, partial [Myodes glareolus]
FKTEFRVPLAGSLGITFPVCDVEDQEKRRPLRRSHTHVTAGLMVVSAGVLVLANKQGLVEQRPSTQELAATVFTHVQGCRAVGGVNLQSDLERLCEVTL